MLLLKRNVYEVNSTVTVHKWGCERTCMKLSWFIDLMRWGMIFHKLPKSYILIYCWFFLVSYAHEDLFFVIVCRLIIKSKLRNKMKAGFLGDSMSV
jgi:hypothetical protein